MLAFEKFIRQLWHRRVVQFGVVYLGVAWLLLQVAVTLEEALELPNWLDQSTIVLLAIGFPVAIILAWVQETRDGANSSTKEHDDGRVRGRQSVPAIVVLPFRAQGGADNDAAIAEGFTDDITTLLTRNAGLKVAPRQAVGGSLAAGTDPFRFADSLGAHYSVSGSVRRGGDQIRVIAELTDIETKAQIWSQRYDRKIEDLFAIQDEIAIAVVGTVGGAVVHAEVSRTSQRRPEELQAWELVRRASAAEWDFRKESLAEAVALLRKALAIEPDYAPAHGWLANYLAWQLAQGWVDAADEVLQARHHAERALKLAELDVEVIWTVGEAYWALNKHEWATALYDRTIAREPDLLPLWPYALASFGVALAKAGRGEEGLQLIDQYGASWPQHSQSIWQRTFKGLAEIARRNYVDAASLLADPRAEFPAAFRLVALVKLEQMGEALEEFANLQKTYPHFSLDHYIDYLKGYHTDGSVGQELSDALVSLRRETDITSPHY